MSEYTCGLCGEEFGSNCAPGDIQCTADECEARLCPCCGSWFTEDGTHSHAAGRDSLPRRVAELRGLAKHYRQALECIAKDSEGYDPGTNEHAHHSMAVAALTSGSPDSDNWPDRGAAENAP